MGEARRGVARCGLAQLDGVVRETSGMAWVACHAIWDGQQRRSHLVAAAARTMRACTARRSSLDRRARIVSRTGRARTSASRRRRASTRRVILVNAPVASSPTTAVSTASGTVRPTTDAIVSTFRSRSPRASIAEVDGAVAPKRFGGRGVRGRLDDEERIATGQSAEVLGLGQGRRGAQLVAQLLNALVVEAPRTMVRAF